MIRHAYQSATPNNPASEISSDRWNEQHVIEDGTITRAQLAAAVQAELDGYASDISALQTSDGLQDATLLDHEGRISSLEGTVAGHESRLDADELVLADHESRIAALEAASPSSPWDPGDIKTTARASAPAGWLLCDGAAVSRATFADLFAAIDETFGPGDGSTTFNVPDFRGRAPIGVGTGSGLTARALADQVGAETHQLTEAEMPSHTHVQDAHTHVQNSHNHTQDAHNHTQDAHTHTQNSHNHTQDAHTHTQNSHNHTQDAHGHTVNDPGHSHTFATSKNATGGEGSPWEITDDGANNDTTDSATTGVTVNNQTATNQAATATNQNATATNQAATATNQNTTATNQATTATNQAATATNQNATATNQNTGGDTAHNNMQPSLAVNFIIKT